MLFLPPPSDVTLELMPMPLEVACERFAEVTGERWEPVGLLKREVVAVRLDHAPLPEVKRRLATILEAKWQGNRLMSDPEAKKARYAERGRKLRGRLRDSLVYLQTRLAEQPAELTARDIAATKRKKEAEETLRRDAELRKDWNNLFRDSKADEETPGWRALARLAPLLPLETCAPFEGEPQGSYDLERNVFSDVPTAMQRPLPILAKAALDAYRRELKVAGQPSDFTRVVVAVEVWGNGQGFDVKINAFGADGTPVAEAAIGLATKEEKTFDPEAGKPAVLPPGEELPISAETRSYFDLVHNTFEEKTRYDKARLRAEWAPRLSDPVKYEPLVWQRGEAYVRTAAATKRQMVAWMSDFQSFVYDEHRQWLPARFLPPVAQTVTLDGDWMMVGTDREVVGRIDRATGGRLVADSLRLGGVPLDGAAAIAANQPRNESPFTNWLGDSLTALFTGSGRYSTLSTTLNDSGLRLWGGLTPVQRLALKEGRSLRLSGLPFLPRDVIFDSFFRRHVDNAEPTDLLPNGLEDGTLTLKVEDLPVTIGWNADKGQPDELRPMSADGFGKALALGIPYTETPATEFLGWNRFRMGVHHAYRLTIRFDRGPSYEEDLSETFFPPNGATLAKLPAAFAEAVAKARANAKAPPKSTEGAPPP